jgi:hypothetical protein
MSGRCQISRLFHMSLFAMVTSQNGMRRGTGASSKLTFGYPSLQNSYHTTCQEKERNTIIIVLQTFILYIVCLTIQLHLETFYFTQN